MAASDYTKLRDWDSTRILPPLTIGDESATSWGGACDLLVIGYGASGASTALEGAERGLDVILVDRFQGGGASELSGGVVYAGGGTKPQRDAGHNDTPEAMFEYLSKEVGNAVGSETLRRFCNESVETLTWLERHGARYSGPEAPHKTSYPAPRDYLYYPDNATVPAYAGKAPPAPRGHRTMNPAVLENRNIGAEATGPDGGFHLMAALKNAIAGTKNIRVVRQATAKRLIVDRNNDVLGVEIYQIAQNGLMSRLHRWAEQYGKHPTYRLLGIGAPFIWLVLLAEKFARPVRLRARKGVVLSAGGFVHNRSMVAEVAPKYLGAPALGSLGCDGSGLRLGLSAGAGADWLGSISAWRFVNPPYAWVGGIVVGPNGKRLVNEEQYGAVLGHAMYERANGKAWLIVDNKIQNAAIAELNKGQMHPFQRYPVEVSRRRAAKADSIAKLADKAKLPAVALAQTVAAYNEAIAAHSPDALGKSSKLCAPISSAPYYAIDIKSTPLNPIFAISLGGLKVDEETGQVMRSDGERIKGLYAAGRNAVGIPSKNYVSGLSLADCVWSGRRAGCAIAALES